MKSRARRKWTRSAISSGVMPAMVREAARPRTPVEAAPSTLATPNGRLTSRLLAFQLPEHAIEHRRHRLHLVLGQLVEEVALDSLGVRRCRLLDGSAACLGQPHHQTPSILGTLLSDDEAPLFHPAEVMGKPAAVPTDLAAQVASSQEPVRRL